MWYEVHRIRLQLWKTFKRLKFIKQITQLVVSAQLKNIGRSRGETHKSLKSGWCKVKKVPCSGSLWSTVSIIAINPLAVHLSSSKLTWTCAKHLSFLSFEAIQLQPIKTSLNKSHCPWKKHDPLTQPTGCKLVRFPSCTYIDDSPASRNSRHLQPCIGCRNPKPWCQRPDLHLSEISATSRKNMMISIHGNDLWSYFLLAPPN